MTKFIDTTGNQYGYWTVVEELHNGLVRVICICGAKRIVDKYHIMRGHSKSCGCKTSELNSKRTSKIEIGQKFGKLTVIGFDRVVNKTEYFWKCTCDCGTTGSYRSNLLKNGGTKSCGCNRNNLPLLIEKGNTSFNCLLYNYKRNAEKRGILFDLTTDQFRAVTILNCKYCGKEPYDVIAKGNSKRKNVIEHSSYTYSGVDRINSDLGYTIDNVAPCCWKCNVIKNNMKLNDFKSKIIDIHNHTNFKKFNKNYFDSLPKGIPNKNCGVGTMMCYYRRNARYRNVLFELTLTQFYYLTKEKCFYCGNPPFNLIRKYIHNGIDRVDNNKGYIIGNAVPCCKRCNVAKGSMTVEEFRNHIEFIYNNWACFP